MGDSWKRVTRAIVVNWAACIAARRTGRRWADLVTPAVVGKRLNLEGLSQRDAEQDSKSHRAGARPLGTAVRPLAATNRDVLLELRRGLVQP